MIGRIIAWFTDGGLGAIAKELGRAYENKLRAGNDQERIEAEKQIAQLEMHRAIVAIVLSEQDNDNALDQTGLCFSVRGL